MISEMLIENTHFNQNESAMNECTEYINSTDMVQSMIEGVQITQEAFEKTIDIAFAEIAAEHNIGSFTESSVDDMVNEDIEYVSEAEEAPKSEEKSGDKKGFGSRIVEGIKKLWNTFLNAVNTVINTIKTYVARDLKKFVANTKLKSTEELAKIKVKKFTKIKPTVLSMNKPEMPSYIGMSKDELSKAKDELKSKEKTKALIKQITGIDAESVSDYVKKANEAATEQVTDVTLDTLVGDARDVLNGAAEYLKLLNGNKKDANEAYKKSVTDIKSKAKSVKKTGEVSDEQGNKAKVDDKDSYALASSVTLEHLKIVHNIEMSYNSIMLSLAKKDISLAKSVFIKAASGTLGAPKEDKNASEETKAANEAALLEYCEYDTEMDFAEIHEQLASGQIQPEDFE